MNLKLKRVIIGLFLAASLTLPALGQSRVATVDLGKVFEKYWKRELAQAALKEHGAEIEKEYESFKKDHARASDEYSEIIAAANDQSVGPGEREKRRQAAEAKMIEVKSRENAMQTYRNNAVDKIEKEHQRMGEAILKEIRATINAKAKSGGYSMVIDSSALAANDYHSPILLYGSGENDLTEEILKQLNAAAPPPAPAAAADKKGGK